MKAIITAFVLSLWNLFQVPDIIFKTDGTDVEVKVIDITEQSIEYRTWNSPDGPIHTIAVQEVFEVRYANGRNHPGKVNQRAVYDTQTEKVKPVSFTGDSDPWYPDRRRPIVN